jgi:hypothetical protein
MIRCALRANNAPVTVNTGSQTKSAVRRAAFRPLKLLPRTISGLKAALQKQNSANTKMPVSVD